PGAHGDITSPPAAPPTPIEPPNPVAPALPVTPEPLDPEPPVLPPTCPAQPARPASRKTQRLLRMECIVCISSCPSAGGTAILAGCGRLKTGTTVEIRDAQPTEAGAHRSQLPSRALSDENGAFWHMPQRPTVSSCASRLRFRKCHSMC